jgi:signal peptidase II
VKKPVFLILLVLFFDQLIKIWIKTHLMLGEEIHLAGNWAILHFTENNGMAFGMEFEGNYGKLFLSLFRILAVFGLAYYIYWLTTKKAKTGLVLSFSLIFAGAFGNIIDSVFYGKIFNESYSQVATLFPPEGGYSGLLHGKVVDMFYFPILNGHFPDWFPIWANEEFIFFRPVFNLADFSISVGVGIILLNQKKYFLDNNFTLAIEEKEEESKAEETNSQPS